MAEKEILVSLHGNRVGLDADGDLIIDGRRVTNLGVATGAKNGSTVSAEITSIGNFRNVKLTCSAMVLDFTDEADQGQHAGTKVYDFEAGLILFFGMVVDGDITLVDDAGTWTATWDGDFAFGTTVNGDAQGIDTATAIDFLASTATAQAVAKVASVQGASAAGCSYHDGTTTAKDMYMNVEIDDAAAHAGDTGTFTGTIEFSYLYLGDND